VAELEDEMEEDVVVMRFGRNQERREMGHLSGKEFWRGLDGK